jgi:hypothetical protein
MPSSAYALHESILGIYSVPSSLHLASLTVLCLYSHLPRQEHEPTDVRHITATRSMHGQLQVTCYYFNAVMCSCDIRHSSADCWLLSAGLQTDSSQRVRFEGPANIVIFYIENKCRAIILKVLKACRRSGGIAPLILNFGTRLRGVLASRPGHLTRKAMYV